MRFSELDGKQIGIWGLGRETRSLIDQLGRRLPGASVAVVADDAGAADVVDVLGTGVRVVSGDDIAPALLQCDVVIRSPGVSIYGPAAFAIRAAGVPMTTATSLWMSEHPARPVIGVTGTKGKSTTSLLVAHLARAAGLTVELAGNVGRPALDLLDEPTPDLYVLELSSYQLADLADGPRVAVFTNLYSEHLPWHGTYAAYCRDKLRMAALPGVQRVVASALDAELADGLDLALAATLDPAPISWFGRTPGYEVTAAGIERDGRSYLLRDAFPLPGDHNALNVCAALAALEAFGIDEPALPAGIAGFRGLPHRLEVLGDHGGLIWVNDSISTTPESTLAGLSSFSTTENITLLAGGLDRGQDFTALGAELARRKARLITLRDTGPQIAEAARAAGLAGHLIADAGTLERAVELARDATPEGGVVLLSPAGASQPHYVDFERRGDELRALVTGNPVSPRG
jgi:UDP-N-acetylmuramoylalanine--D-glutamate ligase